MTPEQNVQSTVTAPFFKVGSVWAAVGFTSWSDVAGFLAALYSLLLLLDFVWKKFGRPLFEDRGWLKRKKRRADDTWVR